MPITLPSEWERFVEDEVARGRYQSPGEVVEAGLRLLQERARQLESLRADIQIGLDQLARGEGAPLDMAVVKARVRERLAAEGREG